MTDTQEPEATVTQPAAPPEPPESHQPAPDTAQDLYAWMEKRVHRCDRATYDEALKIAGSTEQLRAWLARLAKRNPHFGDTQVFLEHLRHLPRT